MPTDGQNALEIALIETASALQGGLLYLGLSSTMTLIDMCASLSDPDGRTDGARYIAWFNANLANDFRQLTAEDAWGLRCGLTHQGIGKTQSTRKTHHSQHTKVLFVTADMPGFQDNAFFGVYMTSLRGMCEGILQRIASWYMANRETEPVKTNLDRLLRYRKSFPPYTNLPGLA